MAVTTRQYLDDTAGIVQTIWGPMVEKELRERNIWSSLLMSDEHKMEDIKQGDTKKITFIKKPTSTIRTIDVDADSFDTNVLETTQVDLVVNRRAVSGYEFNDASIIMSQLESEDSQIRQALLADIQEQVNTHLKSLISPSSSSPAHVVTGVTDMNNAALSANRLLASKAKWKSSGEPWIAVMDPTYMSDSLDDTTLAAADVMGDGVSPMVAGQFVGKRHGFNLIEDESLAADKGYFFIPSFMRMVMGNVNFQIEKLLSNKQFGFILVADVWLGAVQLDNTRVISNAA